MACKGVSYFVIVIGLWTVCLFGTIRRFHPTAIKRNYPSVGLENRKDGSVLIWDHLPKSKFGTEKDGIVFQIFSSEDGDSICETDWHAKNYITVNSTSGLMSVNLQSATHYSVCQVGHPIPIEGSSRSNLYLPCYHWHWGEARFTTRTTCRFDEVGWVIFFIIVYFCMVCLTFGSGYLFGKDDKVSPAKELE